MSTNRGLGRKSTETGRTARLGPAGNAYPPNGVKEVVAVRVTALGVVCCISRYAKAQPQCCTLAWPPTLPLPMGISVCYCENASVHSLVRALCWTRAKDCFSSLDSQLLGNSSPLSSLSQKKLSKMEAG